jgi:hypothetical protein
MRNGDKKNETTIPDARPAEFQIMFQKGLSGGGGS